MLRIITSDDLRVAADTRKQEMQRKLIQGWELREPGRCKRGKAARELFLLRQKENIGILDATESEKISELKEEVDLEMRRRLGEEEPEEQEKKPKDKVLEQ